MTIAVNVLKRDGSLEPFAPEKIARSCTRAGISAAIAEKIAEDVSRKVYINIPTSQIRKMVVKALSKYDPMVARVYLSYEIRLRAVERPRPAWRHRHRPAARRQAALAGKAYVLPSGHKIGRSRLAKKKVGLGRPPR